jgi:hypothetical protein
MTRRVAVWVIAAAAWCVAIPSAGFSFLGGILEGSTPKDFGTQNLDACAMPLIGFWRAYQSHVWAFELGVAAVIGTLALLILWAALRGKLVTVVVLAALIVVPSTVPWLTQYDRGGDAGPKIFKCHGL